MTEPNGRFTAVVTEIRLESRIEGVARWQMALDRTLFSAASPIGLLIAVAPSGTRLEIRLLDVVEEEGVIWHVVDKPLAEGTAVCCDTFQAHPRGCA